MNGEGSFQCVCEAGYRPTPDRSACIDVDECSELKICRNGRCHNTPGSFRCECLPGFTLSNDGRTCLGEICFTKLILIVLILNSFLIYTYKFLQMRYKICVTKNSKKVIALDQARHLLPGLSVVAVRVKVRFLSQKSLFY